MSSVGSVFQVLLSLLVTVGAAWLFSPAWTAAIDGIIDWDEEEISEKSSAVEQVLLSIVIPAYNEEARIQRMIHEAHFFLTSKSGRELLKKLQKFTVHNDGSSELTRGVEWVIVDDGSSDSTCAIIKSTPAKLCSNHSWKLISLKTNCGKGAAVKTGMLRSSGLFRLMVDADGATEFGVGLQNLVDQLHQSFNIGSLEESPMVAIFGSRAHLQEEATAKRSLVRSLLMYAFHFFVSLLVSTRIRDTQCGFKLFSKPASNVMFGTLHLHRWAFDTEVRDYFLVLKWKHALY